MAKVNRIFFFTLTLVNCFIDHGSTRSVSVCPGEQLNLTCSTNDTFIEWIAAPAGTAQGNSFNSIVYKTHDVSTPYIRINQTDISVVRTSTSPLVSVLLIDNVISSLNGATLNCTRTEGMTSTIINVIGSEIIFTDIFVVINEYYGSENVTAIIEFEAQEHVSYITTVTPDNGVAMRVSENTTFNLTVLYNIRYEVSIMATLCRHNSSKNIGLQYVKCEYPLNLPSGVNVISTNFSEPALGGTNVTITCQNNEEDTTLTSNTTITITCMDDGRWEPEPRDSCGGYAGTTSTITCNDTEIRTINDKILCVTTIAAPGYTTERPAAGPLGLIIGVPLALVSVVLVAVVVAAILIIVKGKKKASKSKCVLVSVDTHQLDLDAVSSPPIIRQQIGSSEYSLLQHCPLQNKRSQLQDTCTMDAPITSQPQTLVYADIGPSFDRRAPISPSTFGENKVEYASINIKSLSQSLRNGHSVSNTQNNTSCQIDDSLNLDQLLIQLKPDITSNWYQFGEAIGVETSLMDKWIQYPPEQNLIEVCDHWLRNHAGKPTWREVAEALKRITFKQLAFQIEKVYETGKLTKHIDVNDDLVNNDSESPPPLPPRLL